MSVYVQRVVCALDCTHQKKKKSYEKRAAGRLVSVCARRRRGGGQSGGCWSEQGTKQEDTPTLQ